ncbi:hypothetical protein CHUAL_004294 [Chamberlinius hualienensis]
MTSYKHDKSAGDLKKKTKGELLDLLQRQNNILTNSKLLASLPDNGHKIKNFKEEIEKALMHVSNQDQLTSIFQKLQIKPTVKTYDEELDHFCEDNIVKPEDTIRKNESLKVKTQKNESSTKQIANDNQLKHSSRSNPLSTPSKLWFESAVTPPPARFIRTIPLTLAESAELLKKDQQRRQELIGEQATQVLQLKTERFLPDIPAITFKE